MNGGRARGLPALLEKIRGRFERWRGTHTARSRLPYALWESAAKMVGAFARRRGGRPSMGFPLPGWG
jgi:hypothetical protein